MFIRTIFSECVFAHSSVSEIQTKNAAEKLAIVNLSGQRQLKKKAEIEYHGINF